MYLFIHYPKCSTCQKAKKWLEAQGVAFEARHIVEENPTAEELSKWIAASGQPVKNTQPAPRVPDSGGSSQ